MRQTIPQIAALLEKHEIDFATIWQAFPEKANKGGEFELFNADGTDSEMLQAMLSGLGSIAKWYADFAKQVFLANVDIHKHNKGQWANHVLQEKSESMHNFIILPIRMLSLGWKGSFQEILQYEWVCR